MKITQLGQPVLRKKAQPIPKSQIRRLGPLIQSMIKTMKKAQGVGIAAPQVGKSLRLFIVAPEPSVRYPKAPTMQPLAMINPRLVKVSKAMNTSYEGCLSIPGLRGKVPRYTAIQIEFTSQEGKLQRAVLSGFVARIFQHEFDHINGMVYVDRVRDTRTLMTEKEYRKHIHST